MASSMALSPYGSLSRSEYERKPRKADSLKKKYWGRQPQNTHKCVMWGRKTPPNSLWVGDADSLTFGFIFKPMK